MNAKKQKQPRLIEVYHHKSAVFAAFLDAGILRRVKNGRKKFGCETKPEAPVGQPARPGRVEEVHAGVPDQPDKLVRVERALDEAGPVGGEGGQK
jgi:hypothetical protein